MRGNKSKWLKCFVKLYIYWYGKQRLFIIRWFQKMNIQLFFRNISDKMRDSLFLRKNVVARGSNFEYGDDLIHSFSTWLISKYEEKNVVNLSIFSDLTNIYSDNYHFVNWRWTWGWDLVPNLLYNNYKFVGKSSTTETKNFGDTCISA